MCARGLRDMHTHCFTYRSESYYSSSSGIPYLFLSLAWKKRKGKVVMTSCSLFSYTALPRPHPSFLPSSLARSLAPSVLCTFFVYCTCSSKWDHAHPPLLLFNANGLP